MFCHVGSNTVVFSPVMMILVESSGGLLNALEWRGVVSSHILSWPVVWSRVQSNRVPGVRFESGLVMSYLVKWDHVEYGDVLSN